MKFNRLALGTSLAVLSGSTFASCSEILGYVASDPSQLAYYQKNHPECFPGSSPATTQQIGATLFQQVSVISLGLGSRLLGTSAPPGVRLTQGPVSGMAAGSAPDKWNTWVNLSQSANKYDASPSTGRVVNSADITNLVVGGDMRLDSRWIVGASAALDRGAGSVGVGATASTSTGYAIAPYVGYQLSDKIALDAAIGFGEGENSVGAARTDADRYFMAGNATYADWVGNWQITGKAGYLWAQEEAENTRNNGATIANTAATSTLAQARVGIEAGYWMSNGMMPYLGIAYTADVTRKVQGNAPWDKDGFTLTAGLNFFSLKDKLTGGIAYTDETGRNHTRNSTLMGNLNIRF